MDFSKTDKLTERNKENSFLDVDWIITELINYGHEKLALVAETSMSDVPNSPQRSGSSCSSHALQRSTSLKNVTKVKKKVNIHLTSFCTFEGQVYSFIQFNTVQIYLKDIAITVD